jgi:hypothetical protein
MILSQEKYLDNYQEKLVLLTTIYDSMLIMSYYPIMWKFAQIIIIIPKAGKPANEINYYRPISLLPVTSKFFEKITIEELGTT